MTLIPYSIRLAVLPMLLLLPGTPVFAAEIDLTNCSRSDIRVSLHDDSTGGSIGGREFGAVITSQGSTVLEPPEGRYLVKVFRVGAGGDRFAYMRPGIDTLVGSYLVRVTGAYVFVQPGRECGSRVPAAAQRDDHSDTEDPDVPIATHMVHTGVWVSGAETSFRIRQFDTNAFKLLLNARTREKLGLPAGSGPEAWSTYRLVGRNKYQDGRGNAVLVEREFHVRWNGIAHRYSWLE